MRERGIYDGSMYACYGATSVVLLTLKVVGYTRGPRKKAGGPVPDSPSRKTDKENMFSPARSEMGKSAALSLLVATLP